MVERLQVEATVKTFVIGVLLIAVGALGYLYWDSQYNTDQDEPLEPPHASRGP